MNTVMIFVCCRLIYTSILVGLIVFVVTDIAVDSKRLTSFAGMMLLLLLGFLTSNNPSKVRQITISFSSLRRKVAYKHEL